VWIIPNNYPLYSAFAQAMVVSNEDLSLPGLNIESSLMWRSKPSQLKTWQRRWKTVCWMPRLCGRILKPSHHTSFETKLTLLLEAIHVPLSAQRDNEKAKTTPDTCGHLSENISEQLDLLDASLKMSKATYRLDSQQLSATWKKMVTQQRGEYSQRRKLAHRTDGSECLSWPTPAEYEDRTSVETMAKMTEKQLRKKLSNLTTKVKWATPNTLDYISVVRKREERSEKAKKGGCSNLREQVHWATPNTMDYLPQRSEKAMKRMIRNGQRKNRVRPGNLREQVSPEMVNAVNQARAEANNCTIEELDPPAIPIPQKWPTPNSSDAYNANMKPNKDGIPHDIEKNYLRGTVQNWPTPSAHEARLGYQDRSDPTKKGTQESLTTVIVNKAGGRQKCTGHLNPDWVEQLMGVPPGWTALDGTSNEWHYGWHDGSWEAGLPRVVESCDDRVDRIRLLGNGVVPATAAKAWITLGETNGKG
jgi:hypothetical protein